MEKIIYNNETYYFHNGKIYDSDFIRVSINLANQIYPLCYDKHHIDIFNEKDFVNLTENELFENILKFKKEEYYTTCIHAIEYAFNKFNYTSLQYKTLYPILSSCYRALNQPQKAIDFWMSNKQNLRKYLSAPLLTSLSAAYCDIKDYNSALICIKEGMNLLKDKQPTHEMQQVLNRIRCETFE